MCTHDVQRNLEVTGMSAVRESVTLLNCLQEPDCEAVSLLFVGALPVRPVCWAMQVLRIHVSLHAKNWEITEHKLM